VGEVKFDRAFEKAFRELCRAHNVRAAVVAFDYHDAGDGQNVLMRFYSGGHKQTCANLKTFIELQRECK
jgi:hypothetical protein